MNLGYRSISCSSSCSPVLFQVIHAVLSLVLALVSSILFLLFLAWFFKKLIYCFCLIICMCFCSYLKDCNMHTFLSLYRVSILPLYLFIYLFIKGTLFVYLFVYGCIGSSLLHGLSLVAVSGGYSSLQCMGFSLWWIPL